MRSGSETRRRAKILQSKTGNLVQLDVQNANVMRLEIGAGAKNYNRTIGYFQAEKIRIARMLAKPHLRN